MDHFKISATGVSINYMPEYLAEALGYFAEAGLSVSSHAPSPWTQVLKDIDSGDYHCVVGGIWVPLIYKRRVKEYFAFAKVASRCPLVLVSRTPAENFGWKYLEGKTVLVSGGNGASPGLFVAGCAREGGADMSRIHFVHDFTAPMLMECFQGGWGDVVVLKSDLAAQVVANGKGHVVADLAIAGGAVPWSVYYGTPEFLAHPGNLAGRFTLALQRATTWLLEHSGNDCREILAKNWPKVKLDKAVEMVDMFIRTGMWDKTVNIKREELSRWQKFLTEGRVIDRAFDYEEIIDSRAFSFALKNSGDAIG